MATIQLLRYDSLTNLNSTEGELTVIIENLTDQSVILKDQLLETQKILHQERINNLYNSNASDMIIDDNIFDNDEIN